MIGLGVILFLVVLNIGLFIIPFKVKFTDEEFTNNLISKMVWIFAFGILAFNTTILIDLADTAGLGITQELFFFHWLFVRGLYIAMLLLFVNIFLSSRKILSSEKQRRRMGDYDND